ncbi:MAG: ATP-binding cassette domain-containing protein, partial [Steroidobacteraceae bacterium]
MSHPVRGALRVRLQGVSLKRDGKRILRNVHWDIRPGERWALIGANGAGKTQLMKLVAGDVWPTPGRGTRVDYWVRGKRADLTEIKSDIAYVGAERQDKYERYGWNLTVAQVVATGVHASDLPLEKLTAAQRKRAAALVRRFGLVKFRRRRMLTLSYGERRRVLIARAFAMRPRLLLLDEVFNGLDLENRRRLHSVLERHSRSRVPWIVSAHRAADLPANATHWIALADGKLRRLRSAPALDSDEAASRRGRRGAAQSADASSRALIELRDVSIYRDYVRVLEHVDWTLRAGQH